MIQWTLVFFFFLSDSLYKSSAALYKMSCLAGGAIRRVSVWMGGGLGVLSRSWTLEVDNFSLRSWRFNCSECSWRGVTACIDRRNDSVAGLQGGGEDGKMEAWPQSHQGMFDTKQFPSLTVKCPHYCLILHMCGLVIVSHSWNGTNDNWHYAFHSNLTLNSPTSLPGISILVFVFWWRKVFQRCAWSSWCRVRLFGNATELIHQWILNAALSLLTLSVLSTFLMWR